VRERERRDCMRDRKERVERRERKRERQRQKEERKEREKRECERGSPTYNCGEKRPTSPRKRAGERERVGET